VKASSLRLLIALPVLCLAGSLATRPDLETLRRAVNRGPESETGPGGSLAGALYRTVWAAYAPTNFNPEASPPVLPSEDSIREDLRTLRAFGFNGLVTYGADVAAVPRIAEEVGFRHMLLGVWDPRNPQEIERVKEAAASSRVLGIIVGNEGLMFRRYDLQTLRKAMDDMRRQTGKPVSTTEVIESYFTTRELVDWSDFLAVNAHPYFHQKRDPDQAVEWTVKAYENLVARVPDKPVVFKEVGLPTRGAEDVSEENQFRYYSLLSKTPVRFVYFEAFDALFKTGALEQSWGLFRADRTPKPAAWVPRVQAAWQGKASSR